MPTHVLFAPPLPPPLLPPPSQSITDIVDGGRPSAEEFSENLHKAADALQAALPKLLKFVIGRAMADL